MWHISRFELHQLDKIMKKLSLVSMIMFEIDSLMFQLLKKYRFYYIQPNL